MRGEAGIENGRWDAYKTCIVAPKNYLLITQERFDCSLTYEDLVSWFRSAGLEGRGEFKANFLTLAIDKRASSKNLIDEIAFFKQTKERAAVANARVLLQWVQSPANGVRDNWTTDAFKGTHVKRNVTFLYCNTEGSITVAFAALARHKPFDDPHTRERLLQTMNLIESVSLRDINSRWEGFSIKHLSEF